jgi:hypothetical protein
MRHSEANCGDTQCWSPSGCDRMQEFPGNADLKTDSNWDKSIGSFECEVNFSELGSQ